MAIYTTTIKYMYDNGYTLACLKTYPIYDENYRTTLNNYILNHFWFREIGLETPELFNFYLGNTLNEIMPYYNQLFKSQLITIDPLINYKSTEENTKNNTNAGTTNTNSTLGNESTSNGKNVFSKPADGTVQMSEIEENVYATSVNLDKNVNTSSGTNTGTATSSNTAEEHYIKTLSGITGMSESELIIKYRKSIINVVNMILEDKSLNECFMGVY